MTFTGLYRETVEGLSRPRINDSSIDPDLFAYMGSRERSLLLEKWHDERRTPQNLASSNKLAGQDKWFGKGKSK
jgi:hypothetical protein